MRNTIARQFYHSVGIYTVAFNVPEPSSRKVMWANQHGKRYLFSDGSAVTVGHNTNGKAVWCVMFWDDAKARPVATKLVNVLPEFRR